MPKKQETKTNPVWELNNIVSSNIESAAYHVKRKVLRITFKSGKKYLYHDVTIGEFKAFTLADSHGKYLNEFIKPLKECTEP